MTDLERVTQQMIEICNRLNAFEQAVLVKRDEVMRIELVNAIHLLASDFENSLYAFRDDAEAIKKAKGDIEFARTVAAKYNQNGGAR